MNIDIDIDKWLGHLSRFLSIIRPKAYNVITRLVVGAGITLVISQSRIFEAMIVAGFESYFGRSEVLRDYLDQDSNLHWGTFLIVVGMVYHLLMTVGTDLVNTQLQRVPKYPELKLGVVNADGEELSGDSIQLRGAICEVPPEDEIPNYVKVINVPGGRNGFNMFGGMSTGFMVQGLNDKFFKERAKFLRTWGGSELLYFMISNDSRILAKNVSVCLVIRRDVGVAVDNTNDDFPDIPSKQKSQRFDFLQPNSIQSYDIRRGHSDQEYIFTWNVGDVQAGTVVESKTAIFIRSDRNTVIRATTYCDDLPEPISKEYQVEAATKEITQIMVSDLKVDDAEFAAILDNAVMDGYLGRRAEKEFNKYQHESQEHLPD
ncbi:hypothetical protein [Pseudomonas canadensis]|uniref:hypothetical protein n=1 Tax=Pseudomonas canadensis TaxID=915099 RepID=UPI002893414E|nr:hypothetical protein [Pseudomonas canadensis]WNJ84452.1 hypothetical protein RMQ99_25635 [Pseudomonas canadensis]